MFFDSLTHPTLNGKWVSGKAGETFAQTAENLRQIGALGACAVGLPHVGGYDHKAYYEAAQPFPQLFPVAALTDPENSSTEIDFIAKIGFKAFKVHPRMLKIHPREEFLSTVFRAASENNLVVFLCTYYHEKLINIVNQDPYWHLVRALKSHPLTRVVLLHGGGVRIMEYMELCRFAPNLLLDLSFTIMKYKGSSIEQNIRFILKNFDLRVCVGSDSPEYDLPSTCDRIQTHIQNLNTDKRENILYKNIISFIGHQLPESVSDQINTNNSDKK